MKDTFVVCIRLRRHVEVTVYCWGQRMNKTACKPACPSPECRWLQNCLLAAICVEHAVRACQELFGTDSWSRFFSRTMLFTRTTLPARLAHRYRGFASQDGSFSIPVVNFSKFRLASSPKEKQQTAGEIVSAFKKSGFIYLSNHGIETCRSSPLIWWITIWNTISLSSRDSSDIS